MVCALFPAFGEKSPATSTNALNISGCMTVRSTAHVPPIDQPAMPQLDRSGLTPNFEIMKGTTSLVRWSAALPRTPLTHSVSLLKAPPASTNTNTGALPSCVAAKSSIVFTALPARVQSAGVLNCPPIIITVGSAGGGVLANQSGGRYTSSPRCLKCDASDGITTGITLPCGGRARVAAIAVTVAGSA